MKIKNVESVRIEFISTLLYDCHVNILSLEFLESFLIVEDTETKSFVYPLTAIKKIEIKRNSV